MAVVFTVFRLRVRNLSTGTHTTFRHLNRTTRRPRAHNSLLAHPRVAEALCCEPQVATQARGPRTHGACAGSGGPRDKEKLAQTTPHRRTSAADHPLMAKTMSEPWCTTACRSIYVAHLATDKCRHNLPSRHSLFLAHVPAGAGYPETSNEHHRNDSDF